jgi:hypothetical protein
VNRDPARRLPFSLHWLVLDLVGTALLAAGALGLTEAGAANAPRLAEPGVGWALVGAGGALAAFAARNIVRDIRARAGSR